MTIASFRATARILLGATLLLGATAANAALLTYFEDNGNSANPRGFYDFDTSTGISTLRSTVGGNQRLFGMDTRLSDGTVFAVDSAGGVYTADVDTGVLTFVGASGISSPVGLAFDPNSGTLFGLANAGALYTVNQSTGAFTFVGGTGTVRRGIDFDPSGTLFGFSTGGSLYTLNTGTGAATAVGGSGNPVPSIAEDSTFVGGLLFGTDFNGDIFSTNPMTGNGVLIGSTGMGGGLLGLIAAPSAGAVPEPGTLLLLGAGLLALGAPRRG